MLSGRGIPNFYPQGNPGLAICGACQVALHGLTLGAPRVCGKALVVQSDDPQLTLRLVRRWVADAMRFAQLANAGGEVPKVSGPQTRLVEALLKSQQETLDNESSAGLVAYHLSNSGQGPDIHIFELPSTVVSFLKRARSQRTAQAWGEIERRAWQQVNRTLSAADVPEDERLQYRNYLYDDLFRLPEEAGRFIRLYFLRRAVGLVRSTDPRARYSTAAEADIVSWDLTVLFLEEILSMEQRRIDAIRSLADRLAEEIDTDNNRRLFRNAYAARYYPQVRQLLIRANFHRLQRDAAPVLTFDDYLEVFEEGDELARADWRLAWDLMLIRLIEQLYHRGWLRTNREVLNEVAQDEEEQVQEVEPAAASADA
jgi:CRISPR-associated protein Cst1